MDLNPRLRHRILGLPGGKSPVRHHTRVARLLMAADGVANTPRSPRPWASPQSPSGHGQLTVVFLCVVFLNLVLLDQMPRR
jgi:hypothetical protein